MRLPCSITTSGIGNTSCRGRRLCREASLSWPISKSDWSTIGSCCAGRREFRFGVWDGKKLCASINLTAVEYAAFQNGRLGYGVDCECTGKGIATEFIGKVCGYAFNQLNLHRLEANVMPRNIASQRVLMKCGFTKIGYSPSMIEIAGKWEDHEMFAKVNV